MQIDITACRQKNAHIALHDVGPWRDRTACHRLNNAVVGLHLLRRIIFPVGDEGAVYEIPVNEKGTLESLYSSSFYLEMCVTPRLLAVALDVA